MNVNVRKLAVDAIEKIFDKNSFSNIVIDEYLRKFELSDEDRKLFTNLVKGTVEHYLTLEFYLEPFIDKKKTKRYVKNLLYLSIYQIIYLDIPDYAVVNESVNIAKSKDRFTTNFVNGVLRNFLRSERRSFDEVKNDEIKYLSIKYSFPEWLVAYLLKDYDMDTVIKIFEESNQVKKESIRVNTLKTDINKVKAELDKLGIGYEESKLVNNALILDRPIMNTMLFKKGMVTIQDISSQMVASISGVTKNSYVLDLCSAPGTKTSHLSALMENTGKIFACDIYQHKLNLMQKGFKRLGVNNVNLELIDARSVKDHVKKKSFDLVLCDAPCSGLGVISHKVDLKYQITNDAIDEVIHLQKEIMEATWDLVKVNGTYLYSTCTINKEENELNIREFLKNHSNFIIEKEIKILPFEYHTDGFYICKLKRVR
ncbi:MAG: 16S rRNA (cytosine(967)-C(5))-methyltransferase RsmB [Bacilli bacterium]|nr:16S rRNA (cytosine(967)-C(5))-methyltransferase RsmB [Bacilli bacterium]